MYYLYLTAFQTEKKVQVVKAVRALYKYVGSEANATLRNSLDVVNRAADAPALLWQHEYETAVEDAADVFRAAAGGYASYVIEDHELDQPDDETAGEVDVSYQACKTALTLLAICGGSPGNALAAATVLRDTTEDPLYDEVNIVIHDTFPDR